MYQHKSCAIYVILCIVALWLIYAHLKKINHDVVAEGMENAKSICNFPQFFLQHNRGLKCHGGKCGPYTVPGMKTTKVCGQDQGFRWEVPHAPGYNGSRSDLLWHRIEPRMILKDNSMQCHECGPNAAQVGPDGILDPLAHPHLGTLANTGLQNDFLVPDNERYMSCGLNPGIPPHQPTCVDAHVNAPKCDCQGANVVKVKEC